MLVVVGDLTDGSVEVLAEASAPLGRLQPPLGKYYVTGKIQNADRWNLSGAIKRFIDTLKMTGMPQLCSELAFLQPKTEIIRKMSLSKLTFLSPN